MSASGTKGSATVERAIEDYLVRRDGETGGEVRKVVWPGRRGAPDRLAGWPNGQHGLVELKRPGGSVEAHQRREHTRLRRIGFRVDVIDALGAVDAYIEEMTHGR